MHNDMYINFSYHLITSSASPYGIILSASSLLGQMMFRVHVLWLVIEMCPVIFLSFCMLNTFPRTSFRLKQSIAAFGFIHPVGIQLSSSTDFDSMFHTFHMSNGTGKFMNVNGSVTKAQKLFPSQDRCRQISSFSFFIIQNMMNGSTEL